MLKPLTLTYRVSTNEIGILCFIEEALEEPGRIEVPLTKLPALHNKTLIGIYDACIEWELYEFIPYVIDEMKKRNIPGHV